MSNTSGNIYGKQPKSDLPGKDTDLQRLWQEIVIDDSCQESTDKEYMELLKRMENELPDFRPERKNRRRIVTRICRLAAVWILPLCIFGAGIAMILDSRKKADEIAGITFIQEATAYGEKKEVLLPDGTKVWLNAGSLLVYPNVFIGDKRSVYISGEGFFEVQKDETPFIVHSGNISLEVLGTSFDLSGYADNDEFIVTLETGAVEVDIPGKPKYTLAPKEQLIYSTTGESVKICKDINPDEFRSWIDGGFMINEKPLSTVIRMLERFYGKRIELFTDKYDDVRIVVHFKNDETLENALRIISGVIPEMEISFYDDVIIIR